MAKKRFSVPISIGLVSLVYYVLLSAKQWSWMFVSSDSGDWLTCSNWWIVPQPYGSPLYISLARLLGTFPGNTAITMTILLSCLPAAITVTLVYLIVNKLTGQAKLGIASSLVLLGAGIFLTQSTVIEEYALAIMFLTAAYYFYLHERGAPTALMLGLGTAVHIFILPIAIFWFILNYRKQKADLALYAASGILPYALILALMYLDTPRLLAGSLSFANLHTYLFATGGTIIGTLSVFEAPFRILTLCTILLMSLGLAFVPLWFGLKRPWDTKTQILLMIVCVSLWYHLTCLDPLSWTFMCFALPSLAILVGVGLSKLTPEHTKVVIAGALALICVNGIFLNANTLTNQNPLATTYYDELHALPDDSVVVTTAGPYSLGLFYVMSEGKSLIPIVYPERNFPEFPDFGIEGNDELERVQYALDNGYKVYFAGSDRGLLFTYTNTTNQLVRPIIGLSGIEPDDIEPEPLRKFWDKALDGYR